MSDDSIGDGKTIERPIGDKSNKCELSPGTMLGQYRILRLLGRGGMGEVYEVEHTTLEKRYALKLLPDELASQKGFMERFRREAKVMAHLDHTHIVKVDDFGDTKAKYWLRMELVEGIELKGKKVTTLFELAESYGGKIEQGLLANILSQVLNGLSYAHDKGAIHRDLKPANILLSGKDPSSVRVKISDFGLVRLVGEEWVKSRAEQSSVSVSMGDKVTEPGEDKSGTSTRALLGTYEYMSPEQKQGEEVDERSDLYAVGLMIQRLLTGERELDYGELASEINPELVPEWNDLLRRTLKTKREQRFSSARDMAEQLNKVQESIKRGQEEQEKRQRASEEEEKKKQEIERRRQEEERQKAEEEAGRKEEEETRRKSEEAERLRKEYEEKKRREAEERRRKQEEEQLWKETERTKREEKQKIKELWKKKVFAGVIVVLAVVAIVIGINVKKMQHASIEKGRQVVDKRIGQELSAVGDTKSSIQTESVIPEMVGVSRTSNHEENFPIPKDERLILTVTTTSECWLRVKVDGKLISEITLSKNSEEKWEAKENIELHVGNAGFLKLDLNGRPLGSPGKGVIKNIVIDREGMHIGGELKEESGNDNKIKTEEQYQSTQGEFTNSIGMKFVLIKAGAFMMGSPSSEESRGNDETRHKVILTKDFYLQTTEVTQAQYEEILGRNPSRWKRGDLPVESVTWNDALDFCKKLSQKEGKEYRLPTEAEWEYACRAGTTTRYSFMESGSQLGKYAWYGSNSSSETHEVGQKKPNAWGLYDMHGNVWEWCSDWYGEYPKGNVIDPLGLDNDKNKVVRGGSWNNDPEVVRSANRRWLLPDFRGNSDGFRCARTP